MHAPLPDHRTIRGPGRTRAPPREIVDPPNPEARAVLRRSVTVR